MTHDEMLAEMERRLAIDDTFEPLLRRLCHDFNGPLGACAMELQTLLRRLARIERAVAAGSSADVAENASAVRARIENLERALKAALGLVEEIERRVTGSRRS